MNRFSAATLLLLALGALAGCGGGGGGSSGGDGGGSGSGGGGNGGGGGGGDIPPKFTVGGTVTGLSSTMVLRNNGGDDLTVSANGQFAFKTALASGSAYSVTVQTQPASPTQDCVVANSSGTSTANVTNVAVTCTLAGASLQADAGVRSATLTWTSPASAASFDLFVSSVRDCDVKNVTSCPDGKLFTNVTSPHTVQQLRNEQAYFFRVETVHTNGDRALSNQAGARPNRLAFNAAVKAMARATDGTVYLGGEFTEVGLTAGSAVPLDAATGRIAIPDFPIVEGVVHSVVPDGSGGWYVGGAFSRVGGLLIDNFAHVLADGTVDPTFLPPILNVNEGRFDGDVRALAVSGSTIFVGGSFTEIGGEPRHRLAAFDASGTLLRWSPIADKDVFAIAVDGDMVYAGGSFATIDAVDHPRLAAIKADGDGQLVVERAPHVSGATSAEGVVRALAISGDTVYVGGDFSAMDTAARADLGAFSKVDGKPLADWKPRTDDNGAVKTEVRALKVSGSTVFVGGAFSKINETERAGLAAVDAAGAGALQSWAPVADGAVSTLAVSGSTVYAGGAFNRVNGDRRKRLAAIDTGGTLLPWQPGADKQVLTLATSGSMVYAGGAFRSVGSSERVGLAAIDANGALLPWTANTDDRPVFALATSGSTVYVGGAFNEVGGEPRVGLAAIDASGDVLPWRADTDLPVFALAVLDGNIYAGGAFNKVDGTTRVGLAVINAAGDLLLGAANTNAPVRALAVSGSTIYVGGEFTEIRQGNKFRLAAFSANLGNFMPAPAVLDGAVLALKVSGDTVFVGGSFTKVQGQFVDEPRSRLAAFHAVGSPDAGKLLLWKPPVGGDVTSLAVSGDTVYAGGKFDKVFLTVDRKNLAAIGVSGALQKWNPGADNVVDSLLVDGSVVHVGGSFGALGGALRASFGGVNADPNGPGDVVP